MAGSRETSPPSPSSLASHITNYHRRDEPSQSLVEDARLCPPSTTTNNLHGNGNGAATNNGLSHAHADLRTREFTTGSHRDSLPKQRGHHGAGHHQNHRPCRIILVRHGESEGNIDDTVYSRIPDSRVPLTVRGCEQAEECGKRVRELIGAAGDPDWRVYFYVSPYQRTLQARLLAKEELTRGAPHFGLVYVSRRFLDSLWRDIDKVRLARESRAAEEEQHDKRALNGHDFGHVRSDGDGGAASGSNRGGSGSGGGGGGRSGNANSSLNIVLVMHGLTMRVFLTRWFKWTVEQFEGLWNPGNCDIRVMQRGSGGEYSLAVMHSRDEMKAWGLSPSMIRGACARSSMCSCPRRCIFTGRRGATRGQWNDEWPWNGPAFFDRFADGPASQDCEKIVWADDENEDEDEKENEEKVLEHSASKLQAGHVPPI
eukprot:jgi/Mesen1/3890/ME000208S02898